MKPISILFGVVVLALTSCSKNNSVPTSVTNKTIAEDLRCLAQVWLKPGYSHITPTQNSEVVDFCNKNGIDASNLKFYSFYSEVLHGNENWVHAKANQLVNGLMIFTNDRNFHFKNGVLETTDGVEIRSTTLDTIPSLKITQIRSLFVIELMKRNALNLSSYKDSCLNIQFGYYDLNPGNNNMPVNLVKAWHITPQYGSDPSAYFKEGGELINFFGGMIEF